MHTTYSAKQFFGALVAAVLIAGTAGYFVGRSSVTSGGTVTGPVKNSSNDGSLQSVGGLLLGRNAVTVDDQAPGNQVVISLAAFDEGGGWVAIHEDRDGKPGNVLGAQFFPAGETRGGSVELLRPTVKGVYYAMLHKDDGDHQFDLSRDMPVTDAGGSAIMMRFVADENISESL